MIGPGPVLERILVVAAGPAGGKGLEWRYPLYAKVKLEQTYSAWPSKAEIQLYNLADSSIALLQAPGTIVTVSAGTGTAGTVYRGDLLARDVRHKRDGSDWVTTLTPRDGGRRWLDGKHAIGYPPGMTWGALLASAAQALALPLGFVGPGFDQSATCAGPWIWDGPARSELDAIVRARGCRWFILSGRIVVLGPRDVYSPGSVPLIAPETGLIGSPERVKGKIVKLKSVYLPQLRPGGGFVLRSRFISGPYIATAIGSDLATPGDPWESEITARPQS